MRAIDTCHVSRILPLKADYWRGSKKLIVKRGACIHVGKERGRQKNLFEEEEKKKNTRGGKKTLQNERLKMHLRALPTENVKFP